LEAVFDDLKGVASVESGYMGGRTANPTYAEVCTGETGHAEVARLSFDPEVVSFKEILEVFFVIHDPTTLNQQGNDVGTQYRSAVFYHSAEQKSEAEQVIANLTRRGSTMIQSSPRSCRRRSSTSPRTTIRNISGATQRSPTVPSS